MAIESKTASLHEPTPIHAKIFGFALALSSATQLRVGGIGPSELLLALVLLFCVLQLVYAKKIKPNVYQKAYGYIVLNFFVFGFVGVLYALQLGTAYHGWVRQMIFIFFPLLLPLLYCLAFGNKSLRTTLLVFSTFSIIIIAVPFLFTSIGINSVGPVDFMYANRFTAWAKNPNQTALVIGLAVPSIYMFLLDGEIKKKKAYVLLAIGIFMGLSTRSDALLVCWLGIVGIIFIQKGNTDKKSSRATTILKLSLKIAFVIGILGASLYWMGSNAEDIYTGVAGGQTNQGQVRVTLWINAFNAFLDSPYIGHGHGHFSGLFSSYTGSEAHNFYFDWLASYGAIGFIIFLLFIIPVLTKLVLQKRIILFGLVVLVMTLSVFHFYGRHPVFWVYLFFAGSIANRKTF